MNFWYTSKYKNIIPYVNIMVFTVYIIRTQHHIPNLIRIGGKLQEFFYSFIVIRYDTYIYSFHINTFSLFQL